ncbi:hypothetical protein J6P92_00230 [bacterium]|nr:hypothetical protein [bacterium]
MKIFKTMIEGFHKVLFGSQNALLKHVCIIALTAIVSYFSVQSEFLKGQLDNTTGALPDLSGFFLGLLAALIVGCYMFGYSLSFMHNVYHEDPENCLPEFDENPFKIFFKSFPLILVWILYFLLLGIVSGLLSVILIGLVGFVVMLIMAIGLQFIWVEFSRDFDRTGLFSFKKPFEYIGKTIVPLILMTILYIFIYILCMIPIAIVGGIMGFMGIGSTAITYTGGIIGGYIGFILQLVWYYCIVKLYKEKFEHYEQ